MVVARKRQTAQSHPIVIATATNTAISATGSRKSPIKPHFTNDIAGNLMPTMLAARPGSSMVRP